MPIETRSLRALLCALSLLLATPVAGAEDAQRRPKCPQAAELIVHINTASADDLQRLPRIGPARAQAILRARDRLGRFTRLSQLLRVKGIGRATLRALRPHIRLEVPKSEDQAGAAKPDPVP